MLSNLPIHFPLANNYISKNLLCELSKLFTDLLQKKLNCVFIIGLPLPGVIVMTLNEVTTVY